MWCFEKHLGGLLFIDSIPCIMCCFLTLSTLTAVTSSKRQSPSEQSLLLAVRPCAIIPRHTWSGHCKSSIPGLEPLCYVFEDFLIMLISKKKYFWSKYRLSLSVRFWKLPVFCLVRFTFLSRQGALRFQIKFWTKNIYNAVLVFLLLFILCLQSVRLKEFILVVNKENRLPLM